MKTSVVTGAGGMDGFYLTRLLLSKGHKVIAVLRRSANDNSGRIKYLVGNPNLETVYGDITDAASMARIVAEYEPDEFYHLAANSFVGTSWDSPSHVIDTNTIGTINCLEAIREHKRDCRFYFASSSETYGNFIREHQKLSGGIILNEDSPMTPASPYGVSKLAGYNMTKVYRKSYDMFASCGILFNHSAELRGKEFFTRKVTSGLANIKLGNQKELRLGNLAAERDEGYSGDYVDAIYRMLQHEEPDDFVIATGKSYSMQKFLDLSLDYFNLLYEECIVIDPKFFRPYEVEALIGDASKAREILGWKPKVSFRQLVNKMCEFDLDIAEINDDVAMEKLL